MPMKASELKQFERTICDCNKCKAGCHTMPGSLAPGDLEEIADYTGGDVCDGNWLAENFLASTGVLIQHHGETFMIPTIVPAQQEDGKCVFLTDDEKCSIHPVSPFGCRIPTICGEDSVTEKFAIYNMYLSISNSRPYLFSWGHLHTLGHRPAPLTERKMKLQERLEEL